MGQFSFKLKGDESGKVFVAIPEGQLHYIEIDDDKGEAVRIYYAPYNIQEFIADGTWVVVSQER